MKRQERQELEEEILQIERSHPKWNAAALEVEVARRAPAAYGNWKDETPNLRSRLRAIQRWRRGVRGRDPGAGPHHLFPFVWPVGERQRRESDPTFTPSSAISSGSWRIFLYNCSPEVVRDLRVSLDEVHVDYAPAVLEGKFMEIHWQKVPAIKESQLAGYSQPTQHELLADFVIARGTRQARVRGTLTLHPAQGWVQFESSDERSRDIE